MQLFQILGDAEGFIDPGSLGFIACILENTLIWSQKKLFALLPASSYQSGNPAWIEIRLATSFSSHRKCVLRLLAITDGTPNNLRPQFPQCHATFRSPSRETAVESALKLNCAPRALADRVNLRRRAQPALPPAEARRPNNPPKSRDLAFTARPRMRTACCSRFTLGTGIALLRLKDASKVIHSYYGKFGKGQMLGSSNLVATENFGCTI